MIETVKYDGGVTGDYMRLMEDEEYLRECALQEGILLGTRQNIIKLLEARFLISAEVREKICAQEDLEVLDVWLQYAATASSQQEFLEKIVNH
ncbi:MAG: hypothetical protein E7287_09115 [Lachnospiraceae bacterium]|nr:hypothetical protein [Lachnospiraceae bacterium]